MSPATKVCPDCAEEVRAEARVCRFCNYRFDAAPTVAEVNPVAHRSADRKKANGRTKFVLMVFGAIVIWALVVKPSPKVPTTPTAQSTSSDAASTAQAEAAAAIKEAKDAAACRQDLQCWGDKTSTKASITCREPIESLSRYSFEWTDGWLDSKLTKFAWNNQQKGIVAFWGDKIKFQNGFGAWQDHAYKCIYDTVNDKVVEATAWPGRL